MLTIPETIAESLPVIQDKTTQGKEARTKSNEQHKADDGIGERQNFNEGEMKTGIRRNNIYRVI